MDTPTYWEDTTSNHHVKFESAGSSSTEGSALPCKEEQSIFHYCDGNLNFATVATSEDDEYGLHKKKVSRDPMSHRIIEKRRRDRMNNCLADLSRLIPAEYLKKGRGRIEKTEIIEMAIRHMKHLQAHACRHSDPCDLTQQQQQQPSPAEAPEQPTSAGGGAGAGTGGGPIVLEHYRLGYQECLSEAMHFMVEVEGFYAGDPLCVQLINHLQRHCDRILKGDRLNWPRAHLGETSSSSSSCGSARGRSAAGSGGSSGGGGCLGSSGLGSASASGSGSSPGSCSDSGRTEPRDSGLGSSGARRAQPAQLAPLALSLALPGCCEEPPPRASPAPPLGSQLRDMLTSAPAGPSPLAPLPTSAAAAPASVIHSGAPSQQPPPARPCSAASPGPASDTTSGALYKFKNNIKQRFSAEHHDHHHDHHHLHHYHLHSASGEGPALGAAPPYGVAKRRRVASEADDGAAALLALAVRRRDSETCSVPSPPASPPLLHHHPGGAAPLRSPLPSSPAASPPPLPAPPAAPTRPVPVFALHARGAYYVPLTLDSDALAPYLAECGCGPAEHRGAGSGSPAVALHPVTISVNFTRTPAPCARLAERHAPECGSAAAGVATMVPWKTEPAPWKAEPGAYPAARWPECVADRG